MEQARKELQELITFSQNYLNDSSSIVRKEIQRVIVSVKRFIQETEMRTKSVESTSKSHESSRPVMSDNVPFYLRHLISCNGNNLDLPLSTPTEAVALFCHSLLLSFDGVVCIAEKSDGGVPGFAAPLAPLPLESFVPPGWKRNKDKICFLYKHKTVSGKKITIEVSKANDKSTMVKVGLKNASSKLFENIIDNGEQINLSALPDCSSPEQLMDVYVDTDNFESRISPSILQALPFLQEQLEKMSQREFEAQQNTPMEIVHDLPPSYVQRSHINNVPVMSPSRTTPASVGSSDLHPPLPSMIGPPRPGLGPQGQLPSLYDDQNSSGVYHPSSSSGGMLVGPDHDIFQGGGRGGNGGALYGGAPGFGSNMPQPRFDPITNPGIYTDPMVAPGTRQGQGKGRGRGRGAPRVPGEPTPDHLKPPDFGDDFI